MIRYCLQHRLFTVGMTLFVAAFGIYSAFTISVDSFPDVSNVQVQIITEPESMSADEVEALVTYPLENALNGTPRLVKIRSNSSFGLSVITAIFDDNTDIDWARSVVQVRLNQIDLPDEVPKPLLGPVVSTFSNVLNYYLVSDKYDLTELRTLQDWVVARRLRAVPGVSNVVSYGGYVKQYQVNVSPHVLKSYNLSLKEVLDALSANNSNAGGNVIEQGGEEIIVRGLGRIENLTDIKNIVVKSVDGTPIKVGQIGRVEIGAAFRRGSASMNGRGEVVTGMILTRKGVNTKEVVGRVKTRLAELARDLPEGVSLIPFYDQSALVDKTVGTVKEILLFGGGLVIIVLFAILLNIPSALIVSTVIPLSLLFSFILMKYSGLTANLMTLGAVDFGVIVDAGVVMVENIYRHLGEEREKVDRGEVTEQDFKQNQFQIVYNAAREVGRPIFFAIVIIVSVYLPLFSLEGMEKRLFSPLALNYIYALIGALLASLTVVPVLCLWGLRGNVKEHASPIIEALRKLVMPILSRSLLHPKITLAISSAVLLLSLCLIPFLGSEFIPTIDEGSILLRTKLPASVSLTESRRVNNLVESAIKEFSEVDVCVSRIGRSGMGSDLEGVDNADIFIGLKPRKEWKNFHKKDDLVNAMSQKLSGIPGVVLSFSQPIADMIDDLVSGIRADLGIKIFGDNLVEVDNLARNVENAVRSVRGCCDLQREHTLGLPQLNIRLKRDVIARYDLNVEDVQDIISSAVAGKKTTEVFEGNRRFGLVLRFPKEYRDSVEDIEAILIDTPSGVKVPLKQLAAISVDRGTNMINREDGERRTAVLANVRGRDLGGFVEEVRAKVAADVKLPPGCHIVWGGQFENQQRAMARLSVVVPVVLLIIFVLLYATLHSLRNAFLVMLNVPFAIIGGIVALFISHEPISVPAIVGFIALFGVAVQNGVIIVSYMMQKHDEGLSSEDAAVEGVRVRLRPVIMTAMVGMVGFLPLLLSDGTGAELQRPLATVVIGGLFTATFLTLVVLPSIYALINHDAPKHKDIGVV
ncbi:MAG: CusA/CzcA family heavy metal efflux RND transporter [Cyanobacteria bacterium REEB67]|nr:CusA/CzcA family heavy metal efflux RND transporter [Cyanobacteria bacterium REEB67]